MRQSPPEIDPVDEDEGSFDQHSPILVSLHFIVTTLRRGWLFCAAMTLLGLLAATAFLVVVPPAHQARASVVLAHPEGADPTLAMSTDMGLLTTRAVAAQTVSRLGLPMTPEAFLKTIEAERISPELMTITLGAPTDDEAVRRLATLTTVYLDFRAEQLTRQSTVLIQGMQQRIEAQQAEVADLTQRIDRLSRASGSTTSELSDMIELRASIESKIEALQQAIEDQTLSNNSVTSASRVIDPAAALTASMKRRVVFALASGFIGGMAAGCALVLFLAVTSDRLHRRSDIAEALSTSVSRAVGRVTPVPRPFQSLPLLKAVNRRREAACTLLASTIVAQLPNDREGRRLAIGCIQNAREVRYAAVRAAARLADEGRSVALIDLTHKGSVDERLVENFSPAPVDITVLRPLGVPELAHEIADLRVAGERDIEHAAWNQHVDVTLVMADLDPVVGADYLRTWTQVVMLTVTAGRSGAEHLRSVAELVRLSGLTISSTAVLRTDPTDNSSGIFDRRPSEVPATESAAGRTNAPRSGAG